MLKILIILLNFTAAYANDNGAWFCERDAGKREGSVIWSCGIGDGMDEAEAREHALTAAFREFEMICQASSDCANRPRTVDPQRTSCRLDKRGFFSCTRLIVTTLAK